jgi:hypothetical protein
MPQQPQQEEQNGGAAFHVGVLSMVGRVLFTRTASSARRRRTAGLKGLLLDAVVDETAAFPLYLRLVIAVNL